MIICKREKKNWNNEDIVMLIWITAKFCEKHGLGLRELVRLPRHCTLPAGESLNPDCGHDSREGHVQLQVQMAGAAAQQRHRGSVKRAGKAVFEESGGVLSVDLR